MEELSRKKKDLRAFSSSYIPPKINQHLYKEYLEKVTATSLPLNSALLITRPTVPKELKLKYGRLSKRANKRGKN